MKRPITRLLYGMQYRHLLEQRSEPLMKKYQLNRIDLMILIYLASAGEKDTSKDIQSLNMFTKGHISQSLSRLQKNGYLEIRRDPDDRRCTHNILTEKSIPARQDMGRISSEVEEIVFRGLTEQEIQELSVISSKIDANINGSL